MERENKEVKTMKTKSVKKIEEEKNKEMSSRRLLRKIRETFRNLCPEMGNKG
jgi:hypothetical protein